MIVPCIDLMEGRAVQLVRGERRALEREDLDTLLEEFSPFPLIHVIDLDAAKGIGHNRDLVERIARRRAVRVGGGVRSVEDAARWADLGAHSVILGSGAYGEGGVATTFLEEAARRVGSERLVLAVDSLGGQVAVDGWRRRLDLEPLAAVRQAEPYVGGFLCTYVDGEGMMAGTDLAAFRALRRATKGEIVAAGGISSLDEIDALLEEGISVALGMAIYTGRLPLEDLRRRIAR